MYRFMFYAWLYCCAIAANAQALRESHEKVIADLMERLIENNETDIDYTDLQDQLEHYNKNKIDLNHTSRDQLQRLFFLDDKQINALLDHRVKYGDYLALYELQTVEALDELTLYYLSYFVTVEENWQADQTRFVQMVKAGRHEAVALFEPALQQRAGFDSQRKADGRSYYEGSPERIVLRYRFNYGNRLNFGFTGEKDRGELFGTGAQQYGFDFNSFHFYYRPRRGLVKAIALGDYQANFGQGLTFGSGVAARKSAFVMNMRRNYLPLRPYRSLNENEFLRGAAITLAKEQWQLVLFGSAKYMSTDYSEIDTLPGEAGFGSVSVSGLHRTAAEAARRHNIFQQVYGGNGCLNFSKGHIGFTHARTFYSAAFMPGDKPYQYYNFKGKHLSNSGLDYNMQWRNTNFFGELSLDNNGALALLSGVIVSLDGNLDIAMLYRNYARNYQASFSNAFGENADGRNEHGLYTGASLKLSRRFVLNLYSDLYKSGWLRYLTDAPSKGVDALAELQYNPSRVTQFYFRFRRENKDKNQGENPGYTDYLSEQSRTVYRFNASYKINMNLAAKSRVELVAFSDELVKEQNGVLLLQDISWSTPKRKLSLVFRMAYFTVDDYNARIYAAENDVLYQYSVPLYQNSGTRYYIVARYSVSRRLELWFKFSETRYSNINTIGSGLDQINGSRLTDLRMQVRVIL